MRKCRFELMLLLSIPVFLVVAGHILVLQRTLDGPTRYLTIQGDTIAYVSMIEGDLSSTAAPFKYRVLVPLLARLLPLSPTESLRVISYASLLICYVIALLTCSKMGINMFASVGGFLTVFFSPLHLYNYHNPFLTDAFGLMILFLMVFFLLNDRLPFFFTAAVIGVLARETIVFLTPVWLTKNWRRGMITIVIVAIVLFVPRYILPSDRSLVEQVVSSFSGINSPLTVLSMGKNIFLTWGFVWFLAPLGLLLVNKDKFVTLTAAFIALLLGAFLSSLIAVDTGRMFSILSPVFVILCAQLFDRLLHKGHYYGVIALFAILIVQATTSVPNILFNEQSRVFNTELTQRTILAVGTVFSFYTGLVLRNPLSQQLREKTRGIIGVCP